MARKPDFLRSGIRMADHSNTGHIRPLFGYHSNTGRICLVFECFWSLFVRYGTPGPSQNRPFEYQTCPVFGSLLYFLFLQFQILLSLFPSLSPLSLQGNFCYSFKLSLLSLILSVNCSWVGPK
jgi:hypothetical protein